MAASTLRSDGERGTAIVESAVIMLGLFMFLFGIMEAGRFLNVQQVVTDAAREGARYGVAPFTGTNSLPAEDDLQGVVSIINQFLASAGVEPADYPSGSGSSLTTIEVIQEPTGAGVTPIYTRVTVTTPYDAMLPIFSMLEIPVVGDVRMRNETSDGD